MSRRRHFLAIVITMCAAGVFGTAVGGAAPAATSGPEEILNGDFSQGLSGWSGYPSLALRDGAGCNSVPAGTGAYGAATRQAGVPVVAGAAYDLTFTASAPGWSGSDPLSAVRVVLQGGPETGYAQAMPEQRLALTSDDQTFDVHFTAPAGTSFPQDATLEFDQDAANPAGYTFCVDNVSLTGGAGRGYHPDTGPRVRVNQVGYLPDGPKAATLVTDATTPLPWQVTAADGSVAAAGSTAPRGVDPTAAENVQSIDFSSLHTSGAGYRLSVDGDTSYPFTIGAAAYTALRKDAMTFFYTQRSGIAISDAIAPGYGRAAGHAGIDPNRGDTAVPCQSLTDDSQRLYDRPWTCSGTRDVSGGWYDAGDQGKYVVNGGIAVAQLMQEYERTKTAPSADRGALGDGSLRVPESADGVPDLLDESRWELEWMLKMQVPAGQQYAGMANHKVADVDWTALPTDPAADTEQRVLYRPSTQATLNLAAVAAQGARLFAPYDDAFARRLLAAARTAYAAALAEPTVYAPPADGSVDPNPGSGAYDDSDATDEFYWAAAELYLTTGEATYAHDVTASPWHTADLFGPDGGFYWGRVATLGRLDLATVPNDLTDRNRVRQSIIDGADRYTAVEAAQPFGQAYDPPNRSYDWGSSSSVLNNLIVIGTAYDLTGRLDYREAVLSSIDYLLGRNALNRSYVTGYGTVSAQNQHTRMYSHELDPALPHPPAGSLAGGPNSTAATSGDPIAAAKLAGCAPQWCYVDDIQSYATNEIAINWNAPLSWVASFVADQGSGDGSATAACQVDVRPAGGDRLVVRIRGTSAVTFDWSGSQRVADPPGPSTATQRAATVTVTTNGRSPVRSWSTVPLALSVPWGANWAPATFWSADGQPCSGAG